MALVAWFDREALEPAQVETAAALDEVLDALVATQRPNLVELTVSGAADPSADAYYSRGTKTDDAETIYYYMGSDTEFPDDAELPINEVRKAAHQFLNTGGERPDGIDWQTDSF